MESPDMTDFLGQKKYPHYSEINLSFCEYD
jgi:hypothetical protein